MVRATSHFAVITKCAATDNLAKLRDNSAKYVQDTSEFYRARIETARRVKDYKQRIEMLRRVPSPFFPYSFARNFLTDSPKIKREADEAVIILRDPAIIGDYRADTPDPENKALLALAARIDAVNNKIGEKGVALNNALVRIKGKISVQQAEEARRQLLAEAKKGGSKLGAADSKEKFDPYDVPTVPEPEATPVRFLCFFGVNDEIMQVERIVRLMRKSLSTIMNETQYNPLQLAVEQIAKQYDDPNAERRRILKLLSVLYIDVMTIANLLLRSIDMKIGEDKSAIFEKYKMAGEARFSDEGTAEIEDFANIEKMVQETKTSRLTGIPETRKFTTIWMALVRQFIGAVQSLNIEKNGYDGYLRILSLYLQRFIRELLIYSRTDEASSFFETSSALEEFEADEITELDTDDSDAPDTPAPSAPVTPAQIAPAPGTPTPAPGTGDDDEEEDDDDYEPDEESEEDDDYDEVEGKDEIILKDVVPKEPKKKHKKEPKEKHEKEPKETAEEPTKKREVKKRLSKHGHEKKGEKRDKDEAEPEADEYIDYDTFVRERITEYLTTDLHHAFLCDRRVCRLLVEKSTTALGPEFGLDYDRTLDGQMSEDGPIAEEHGARVVKALTEITKVVPGGSARFARFWNRCIDLRTNIKVLQNCMQSDHQMYTENAEWETARTKKLEEAKSKLEKLEKSKRNALEKHKKEPKKEQEILSELERIAEKYKYVVDQLGDASTAATEYDKLKQDIEPVIAILAKLDFGNTWDAIIPILSDPDQDIKSVTGIFAYVFPKIVLRNGCFANLLFAAKLIPSPTLEKGSVRDIVPTDVFEKSVIECPGNVFALDALVFLKLSPEDMYDILQVGIDTGRALADASPEDDPDIGAEGFAFFCCLPLCLTLPKYAGELGRAPI